MSRFLSRLGDAVKAGIDGAKEAGGAGHYEIAGARVACPQCGHDTFIEGTAQLNTAGLTFLDLDWANRSATTLVCCRCSYIAWFLDAPRRTGPAE